MKKRHFKYLCLPFALLLLVICSCDDNGISEKNYEDPQVTENIDSDVTAANAGLPDTLESRLYDSEETLDLIYRRSAGETDIVDWRLTKEFAQISLEDLQTEGFFPEDTMLRNIPISVYDAKGDIRYYEFRVVGADDALQGAIICNTHESDGFPIESELLFPSEYSDTLEDLYKAGVISDDNTIRVIDNDYPNYAYAVISQNKGESTVEAIYDSQTGELIDTEDITAELSLDEILEEYPELADDMVEDEISEDELSEIEAEDEEEEKSLAEFWEIARTKRGAVREGVQKKKYKTKYLPYFNGVKKKRWSGGACGPASVNFVLGCLDHKGYIDYNAFNPHNLTLLGKAMKTGKPVKNFTYPHNIPRGVKRFTPKYKTYYSGRSWKRVKQSIKTDKIPGISLRRSHTWNVKKLQWHYRNVCGYKSRKWWGYTDKRVRIIDLNKVDSGWERHKKTWKYYRTKKR